MKERLSDREKLYVILLIIVSGLALLWGIIYCIKNWTKLTLIVIAASVVYSIVMMLINPKSSTGKTVYKVFAAPMLVPYYMMQTFKPTAGIISAYLFGWIMSAIPALCIYIIWCCVSCSIKEEWFIFLLLSTTTILMSSHTELVKKCLLKIGVWKIWNKNDAQRPFVEIGKYMLQPENVHFVCSLLYVLFLVCLSVKSVLGLGDLFSQGIDNAILKAFLVYVAYTTMMMRYKKTEVTVDGTLQEILKMYKLDTPSKHDKKEEGVVKAKKTKKKIESKKKAKK